MAREIINAYYEILSKDFPAFLHPYLELPLLRRLEGVGLLCGTDWTSLYDNRFFYSRLDHSIGVALIIWNFTKDRKQTIAGLLHDVSSPAFSHVMDFRNNDALHQESTESDNIRMLREDAVLASLLQSDGLTLEEVEDYHLYPVADNKMPRLSADRLEYMYMTGLIMEGIWTLDEIKTTYDDISVMTDEEGGVELGFATPEIAEMYCDKCCRTGLIMVKNENKLTLSLLAHLCTLAVDGGAVSEDDFYRLSEKELIDRFETIGDAGFRRLFGIFREMTAIRRSEEPLTEGFVISMEVKRRYIDPLCNGQRLSALSGSAARTIQDLLTFRDSRFAAVGC